MIPNITLHPLPVEFYSHVAFDGDRSVWVHQDAREMTTIDWSGPEPHSQTFTWGTDDPRPRACDLLPLGDGRWAIHTLTGHHDDGGYDLRVMDFDALPQGDQVAPWRCPRFYSRPVGLEGRIIARRYVPDEGSELVEVTPGVGERAVFEPMSNRPTGFSVVPLPEGRQGLLWGGDVFTWEGDRLEMTWPLNAGSRCTHRRMGEPDAHQAVPTPDGGVYFLQNTYSRLHQGGEIYTLGSDRTSRRRFSSYSMPRVEGMIALPDGALLGVVVERSKYALIWFFDEHKYVSLTAKALGVKELYVGGVWWNEASRCLYIQLGRKLARIPWDDLKGYKRQKMR